MLSGIFTAVVLLAPRLIVNVVEVGMGAGGGGVANRGKFNGWQDVRATTVCR